MFLILYFDLLVTNNHYYREEFENNYKEINVDSENVERVSEIKKIDISII